MAEEVLQQKEALKTAVQVFPLEVWNEIFCHLSTSPRDLVSCSLATKTWSNLLKPKRTAFLMSKVFPLLEKYLYLGNPNDILNCRRVCQSWKHSIDDFYHDGENRELIKFKVIFHADDVEKLETFLDNNVEGTKIPFFRRFVSYREIGGPAWDRDPSRLRHAFRRLLTRFGSQISRCEFVFRVSNDVTSPQNALALYTELHSFLQLLPALTTIVLAFVVPFGYDIHLMTPEMLTLGTQLPLPRLERLKTLIALNLIRPVGESILRNNNHVTEMTMCKASEFLSSSIFPDSIKTLRMNHVRTMMTEIWSLEDITRLQSVPSWPLESLALRAVRGVQLHQVFGGMTHFRNTLTSLSIKFLQEDEPLSSRIFNLKNVRLELPNLTMLSLVATSTCFKTIDFLLPCVTLKKLSLKMMVSSSIIGKRRCFGVGTSETIQFDGYVHTLYESNIWMLLEKLSLINIQTTCEFKYSSFGERKYEYSRDGYNRFQMQLKAVVVKLK